MRFRKDLGLLRLKSKKDRATARETATELLAYEHEILNHIPFASANDILMVVVSREFSPLLDHAIAGLVTWGRKRILCLRVSDLTNGRRLAIHLPKAWEAIIAKKRYLQRGFRLPIFARILTPS